MPGAGSSSLLPCKRFMAIAPGQTSKSGRQKCFVNSISMSPCGNKIQVSSKKHLFHEIIAITMLKPKPYGPMALDDYAQSVALALQYVTWLKRFVSYQDWLCTPRPEVNPFSDPTWVFNIHWGSIWGCSWAAPWATPWAPHFAYGHGNRQTG